VLVYKNRVIARGMNATNVTRNGTRHAELMAISALLSYSPASDLEPAATASPEKGAAARTPLGDKTNQTLTQSTEETSTWGDVDPQDGHLYPYGQKLHPSPRVDPSVITECTLYVTVEPCVMCASLLRQFGVKKVYFGAVNDKFGGTGGVFRIHKNSPCSMASAPPSPAPQNGKGIARPVLERRPASAADVAVAVPVSVPVPVAEEEPQQQQEQQQQQQQNPMTMMGGEQPTAYGNGDGLVTISQIEVSSLPGDGGNIERGYEAEGGWGRDEAVTLLRQFYVQENNRGLCPCPFLLFVCQHVY
jgi:tRNA(Arg) A34 adenosine deaminase TadA